MAKTLMDFSPINAGGPSMCTLYPLAHVTRIALPAPGDPRVSNP